MSNTNNKIIVIVGTTASGKTGLGVKLAHMLNGEIISADSRQVYKYMDIGTGKDLKEYQIKSKVKGQRSKVIKIPHYLIDLVHPNTEFSLGKWVKRANKAIRDIHGRGKLPIVVGGTGLYAQALVDGYDLTSVRPDWELRKKLEKKSAKQLLAQLRRLDRGFADGLNESERKNKRRLIRYIEIKKSRIIANGSNCLESNQPEYDFLVLGITWPREVLRKRIYKRLVERLEKEDMVGEVERLHKDWHVSWKRLRDFGLEYKYITEYLTRKIDYDTMVVQLHTAICQFSKRQMTWLRRWERQRRKIHWIKNYRESESIVRKYFK